MKELDPKAAHDLLTGPDRYVYVDVRTVEEFEAGHPAGAWNVPLALRDAATGRMAPNPRFVAVMEANFPKDSRLLFGCKSGGRSGTACQILAQAGYQHVASVVGGFLGKTDPLGRVTAKGWAQCGLPVETHATHGTDYASLSSKIK